MPSHAQPAALPKAAKSRSRSRSPMAAPQSFLWTRRVILAFLTAFVLLPVYVMVSSSLKPLQDVSGSSTGSRPG